MLVPLRIGSAFETKILVSLAQGVPVIATSVGAEGLMYEKAKNFSSVTATRVCRRSRAARSRSSAVEETRARWSRRDEGTYSAEEVRRRRNEIYARLVRGLRTALR